MASGVAILALVGAARAQQPSADATARAIIAAERAALDKWGNGEPQGYLDLYGLDVTYFDPMQAKRLDGHKALEDMSLPLKGKIKVSRYDFIDPKVQQYGDVAVLSYRIVSYVKQPTGAEVAAAKWNSTQVFHRVNGAWKTVHVHWSFTQPELKNAPKAPA
jgi:ketosteroid isomerase-like protein